jgi:hypothetical protein
VKVSASTGEHYPHLFVTDDPAEIRYAESPAAARLVQPHAVVDITEQQWAGYRQAEDAYYEQVAQMNELMMNAIRAREAGK